MKRIISILLTFTIIITSMAIMSFCVEAKDYQDIIGNFRYLYDSAKKELIIDGNGALKTNTVEKIFSSIEDQYSSFNRNKTKSLYFDEGITSINGYDFGDCEKTQKISFPSTLKQIKNNFGFCYFMGDVKKISVEKGNKYFVAKNSILFNKNKTVLYWYAPINSKKSYKVPNTVKTIKDAAFAKTKTKTITMGNNVKKMENNVFAESNVSKVVLSSKINKIPEGTFWCCQKLKSVVFSNKIKSIGVEAFAHTAICKSTKIFKVPDSVTTINKKAFFNCENIKGIIIPESVKKIGKYSVGFYYNDDNRCTEVNKKFVIYGKKGSAAYKYAKKNKIKFKVK